MLSDMETQGAMDSAAAAGQLDELRADRERLADRVVPPWWYDPALGVVVFLLVSALSLRDAGWWYFATLAVGIAGLGALVRAYRRITGIWVSGFRKGATRRAIHVWLVAYAVVVGAAAVAEFVLGLRGAMVVAGAVLGVTLTFLGRWWTRLYVAELRGGL
jgi:hypothetical protein